MSILVTICQYVGRNGREAGSARACVPRLSHQLQHRGDYARLEGQGVEIDRQTAATRAVFSHAPLDHLARDAMVLQHLLDAISDQIGGLLICQIQMAPLPH